MLINTAVFGPLEVEEDHVFHMPEGLYGFDGIHSYALIEKQEDDATLMWFQAADRSTPCFVVFNPHDVVDGYQPQLEKNDLKALGGSADALSYLVIAVVPDDITQTTVNLKSPIVLNRETRIARQVILANDGYPMTFPLVEEEVPVSVAAEA